MKTERLPLMTALLVAVAMSAAACLQGEVEISTETEPLSFETIGRGHFGAHRDTTEIVVRTREDWQRVQTDYTPLEPFLDVDMTQYMVAVIAQPAESGGFTIEVESVEATKNGVEIDYLVSEPGPDCITPTVLTLPFQAVKIRRAEGEVVFTRRSERYKCGM